MEDCAETLIPNPQKPHSPLITEDFTAPFSALSVYSSKASMSRFLVKKKYLQDNRDGGMLNGAFDSCLHGMLGLQLPTRKTCFP